LLGRAYQVDGKFPYAIDSVLKAIKLAPRNDAYRLALAGIYGEAKQWDDANALLAYLKDSADPEVARQVPQLVAHLEQLRTAPKRTGRFDERPRPSSYDAPKWRTNPATSSASSPPAEAAGNDAARNDADAKAEA